MTVLKGIRKCMSSTPKIQNSKKKFLFKVEKIQKRARNGIFIKNMWRYFTVDDKSFPLRKLFYGPLLLWKFSGDQNELSCSITNLCPILFADISFFLFQNIEIPLVSNIFSFCYCIPIF